MNFDSLILAVQGQAQQGGGIGIGYFLIIGATMLVSMMVSGMLKSRFNQYSQIPLRMTGAQVAGCLRVAAAHGVAVVPVSGLTGIVGGAMYSLSLMMFRAGPKTAAMVAEVCQTLIGSWADPLLGLVGIKPAFNAASGADALRASIHKSPKDLQDDPNVVGQNASVAQRTDLTLPLHAIPEPRT